MGIMEMVRRKFFKVILRLIMFLFIGFHIIQEQEKNLREVGERSTKFIPHAFRLIARIPTTELRTTAFNPNPWPAPEFSDLIKCNTKALVGYLSRHDVIHGVR